jgi:non-specific serine/threonine protein kinase
MFLGDIDQVITPTVEFLTEGDRAPDAPLTGRELEVASLVADGLTNPEIANRLCLSPRTVGAHLEHIREKLGVRSRAQVAAWVTTRQRPR